MAAEARMCPVCGAANVEGARFCSACGRPLAVGGEEHRKLVTVLFCDVVDSTGLGEAADAEAVRGLLARFFERMREIVERDGGTVEKFIGDAVMAVFGVPAVHEDDALRACRAAVEMRDACRELGVRERIGVSSGEVVTGTEERLATGDAVNVAARLEQTAAAGEILVSEATLALVGSAARAEPVEPLALKGRREPVIAFRLVSVAEPPERSRAARFVGRAAERASIETAWQRVRAESRCELVTIIGEPGVGKSRLVAEALAGVEARIVQARCLPYGEGITYWPVVSVLKQLDVMPSDPAAAAAIRSLLGTDEHVASAEEIAWAFRKLLAEQAPLVVVFDDIHFGEETFLDLVEGTALLSCEAPILLLCLARPELLERRPRWPVGLELEPLAETEIAELIGDRVPRFLQGQIARAAGGNPLFVLEMLAVAEQAKGEIVVPETLRALLAARLDQLDRGERRVLERAAVEGEIFHRGSVQALLPEEAELTHLLAGLTRKQLIHPERPQLRGEEGFRFRHLLVRNAAYDALTKVARADLHQRFADWLEGHGQTLVELDEILGYHLEQAARYLTELGRPDPHLADRAGTRLAAAGRRAYWRFDFRAAASLLERGLALTRPLRLDLTLELDLAEAAGWMKPAAGAAIAKAAAERARAAGDPAGEALARTQAARGRMALGVAGAVDELETSSARALELLDAADHEALWHAWWARATLANLRGRYGDWERAAELARGHAPDPERALFGLPAALMAGPRPAEEALRRLDRYLRSRSSPNALVLLCRARLLAMLGRFDEAWALARRESARARELTGFGGEDSLAEIAHLAGDEKEAVRYLRSLCDELAAHGQQGWLSGSLSLLGRSLCALGLYGEAEALAWQARELGGPQDKVAEALWRQVQALARAHRGDHAEAERLAREAVAICAKTDSPGLQGDALCDLAEVLETAGRRGEAIAALHEALDRYERKQIVPLASRVRERLAALEQERIGGTV